MFHAINLRIDTSTQRLDIGRLAECLLFYEVVNVYGGENTLSQLIKDVGKPELLELLEMGVLRYYFQPQMLCVRTQDGNTPYERHDFGLVELVADVDKTPLKFSPERAVRTAIPDKTEATAYAKKLGLALNRLTLKNIDLNALRTIAYADGRLEELFRAWLREVAPAKATFPKGAVRTWELQGMMQVASPVSFSEISAEISKRFGPGAGEWNLARFLCEVLDAHADLHFAARLNADLAVTVFGSPLAARLAADAVTARDARLNSVFQLQDLVLREGKSVSTAISSGRRTFGDLLPVVRRAKLFKKWLTRTAPDESLISQYYKEVTKETWCDSLSGKAMKWMFFKAGSEIADVLLPKSGLLVDAVDALLLDRIVKGWRPNQFVEGPLKKFVDTSAT